MHGQARFLRLADERVVRPLGCDHDVPTDVRLIVTTNQDLRTLAAHNQFRLDLYYRLCQSKIQLPALRSYPNEIPDVVEVLRNDLVRVHHIPVKSISPGAMAWIMMQPWPGNLRELSMSLLSGSFRAVGREIEMEDLIDEPPGTAKVNEHGSQNPGLFQAAKMHAEHEYLTCLLSWTRGRLREAARVSGIDRKQLRLLLARHRLRDPLS